MPSCSREDELTRHANIVAAYVIHMDRRTDRLSNIKNLKDGLADLVVLLETVKASDGSSLPNCLKMQRGAVGCFLSHAGIAERVAANPHFCAADNNWLGPRVRRRHRV